MKKNETTNVVDLAEYRAKKRQQPHQAKASNDSESYEGRMEKQARDRKKRNKNTISQYFGAPKKET